MSRRSVCTQLCVSCVCVHCRACGLLAFVCGEGATEGGVGGRGPAIADGCAGVPAVGVATAVAREGVALVLAARTQGAHEGTPDRNASMHLVASCMHAVSWTLHHIRGTMRRRRATCCLPKVCGRGRLQRCGASAGGPIGCCSSARPCGSATPACPAIVAAPHRSSHGRHAVQRSCDKQPLDSLSGPMGYSECS
jgi:hypothetical protein